MKVLVLMLAIICLSMAAAMLEGPDGHEETEPYVISAGIVAAVAAAVAASAGTGVAVEDKIERAAGCRGGCDPDGFCAYASRRFRWHCHYKSSCQVKCYEEHYSDGYCAFRGPTCRRPGRSCWCTNMTIPWE